MGAKMIGCILMLCVAGTLAGPISWDSGSVSTCATECPESLKFAYEENTVYEYAYENDVQTSIPGSTEEQSSLHMSATVQIEVLSACEMNLKLTDVSLQDSQPLQYESRQHVDKAWDFKRLLQERGMRFAFIDGLIEHVCPEDEPVWVLNIKRGVLSAFQNTQRTLDSATKGTETDITGECPVEYSVAGSSWGVRKVKKVKEMLGCTERHGADSSFNGSPYEIDSSIKSLPLMKTTHECEQEINKNGLLTKSACRELHIFRPFSDGDGGAQTEVTYKLVFTRKSTGVQTPTTPVRERGSLRFDHTVSNEEKDAQLGKAEETMRALCASVKEDDVRPETPRLFADLVRVMKTLDSTSLQRLQASANSMCPQANKYFGDAVPNVGTTASLNLIRIMIDERRVQESEAALWLSHLAFVPRPTRTMLSAVQPLLRTSGEIQRKAALAISSMVHNFCKLNKDCADISEVRDIIQVFVDNLNYNCRCEGDTRGHESIMIALKALGNTGNAQQLASQTLIRCAQNKEEAVETRVAAILAFRRMACTAEQMDLMRLLGDENEDSEVRINAYLMLMNCPNEDIVRQIQQILKDEEVNQVGSFVYTHLTNLMESSDPSKRELRDLLRTIDLKVFDLDMRKFSRNIEWSMFSDVMNMGARADSNIIFSTDSYVPRSAMVNLTMDMFGQSVNLFEMGGRIEGVEKLLERLFRGEDNSLRQRRDVIRPSLLDYMDKQFKVAEHDGPKASYFVKLLGHEIHFDQFHGLNLEEMKDKLNFFDWLIKLSQEQQYDYTKSYMLMDSTLVIPTAVGMPLKLAMDGTATVNVKMDGKVDVRQMFSNPSTFDINGAIKPSAAVEFCKEMVVDAFVARTGLKMVTTVHTSTVAQGKISLLESRVFHFDLEMPRDKQEIINLDTKFYVQYREEEREQQMIRQGRTTSSNCYELTEALGIEVCGEMSMPVLAKDNVAKFPFTGPHSAAVYINKKDTFTKCHVDGSYDMKKSGETEFKVNINTPGSKVDREIDIFFNYNPTQRTSALNIKTPWKKAVMTGEVTNTDSMKRVSAKAIMDDRREYTFVSEVAIDEKKFGTSFTPKVELVMNDAPPKALKGTVFYRDNKKFEVNLGLTNVFQKDVTCEGSILKVDNAKRMKYDVDLNIDSQVFTGKVDGFVDHLGDTLSSRVVFAYKNAQNKNERVVFNNKVRDKSTKTLTSWSLDTALSTSFWPRYDTDISVDYTFGRNTLSATLDAGFDKQRRVKFSNSANYLSTRREMRMDGQTRLEVPHKGLEYELSVNHLHDDRVFNSNALLRYHGQTAEARIDAKRESTDPVNAYAKAFLTYPGREMSVSHTIIESKPNEYENDFVVQLDKYTKATADVLVQTKPRYEVTANVNLPELEQIKLNGHFKPDVYNLQVHGAAQYVGRKYFLTAAWDAPRNLKRDFKGEHVISFGCPYRSMELTGKLSQRGATVAGEHEFKWDLERNPDKKVNGEWSVTVVPNNPQVMVKASWFPNKFVKVEAAGKYETEGWYRTSNDLEGSVKFTSSFPYLENIDANFKHDYGHDRIASTGQVTWGPRQKVDADFTFNKNTWKQVESSLKVNTPFPGFRSMEAVTNHKLMGRNLESMASFKWEQQMIKMTVKGSADLRRHFVQGDASFTSPFRGFQAISLSGKHQDDGREFNSNLDVSWAPYQRVTTKFTMAHQRNGFSINNNGELFVTTPFNRFKQNKLTWTHMNKDGALSTRLDSDNDGVSSMISVDGNFDNSPRKTELSGNFMFDTPYASDIRVKVNHIHNKKGISSNGLVQWAKDQVIEYIHDIKYEAFESLEVAAKLTTPFRSCSQVTLESQTKKTGPKVNTLNEVKWNPNAKVNIDGTLTMLGGQKFNGNMRVTTPFYKYERTVLNVNNDYAEELWMSHADLDIARRHYEVDTKLGMDRRKKITIDASKMDYGFMIDAELSGHARDFTALLSGKIPMLNANPLGAELKANTANLNNIKCSFILNTPWRQAQTVKATVGHKHPAAGNYMTDASFEMPRFKGSASHTVQFSRWSNFDCQTVIEYQDKKIELTSEMKDGPAMEGKLKFTSPFCEPVTLIATHEGGMKAFKSGMELTYRNSDKISADVDFSSGRNQIEATARFVSPYTERVVANVNHRGPWKNFENDASVEVGRKRLAATSKFNLNGFNVETSGNLELPFRKVRNVQVSLNHGGEWKDFASNIKLEVDGQNMMGDCKFSLNGNRLETSAELLIPCWVRSLRTSVNHQGGWKNFQNDASFEVGSKKLSGQSRFNMNGNDFTASANLDLPLRSVRNIKAEYNHEGPINNFKCSSALTVDGQRGTHSMEFKNAKVMSGKAEITTPFNRVRSLQAEFEHDAKKWNSFENSGKFRWNNKEYSGNSELRWYGDTLRVIGNLKTPRDSYVLKVKHKGDRTDFTNSAVVDLSSGNKYSAESSYKTRPDGQEGAFSVASPHQNFDKMSGEFSTTSNKKTYTVHAQLKTPFDGYEKFVADTRHAGDLRKFTSSATIKTPFRKLPSATVQVAHEGDRNEFASTANVEYSGKTVAGAVDFKNAGRTLEGSASLTTDYPSYDHFMAKFSHTGAARNFKSSAEIQTPFSGHERYSAKLEHAGTSIQNFKTSGSVDTPFSGFETTSFDINHNGDLSGMTTEATLQTSQQGYESFDFNVNHNGDPKNVRTMVQLKTPIPNFEDMAVSVNHKGNMGRFESGAEIRGPWRTIGGNVRHSGNLNNFNTEVTAKLPVAGFENWGVTVSHNGDLSQFSCNIVLTMPFSYVPELKVDVDHRGSLTDFSSGVSAEYNGKRVHSQVTWKYDRSYYAKSYAGSLKFSSPWKYFRYLEVSGQHKREGERKTGDLLVNHNGVKKFDFDYGYTTGANKNIRITVTEPKIFEMLLNFDGTGPSFKTDASFEWERTTNVKIELDVKNQVSGTDIDRQLSFKTTIPSREVGFDVTYVKNPEKTSQTTEIQWDRDQASKVKYALELSSSNYRRRNYDGSFKFDSALLDFETTFNHVMPSERQATTTVTITMDETLTIKREATYQDNGAMFIFTTSHPRFSRDAILKVDVNMADKITEGEIDVQFERESINFKGKVEDKAASVSEMKYTASSQLTYPNMRLDMKFEGDIYNNRVGCGGDVEFNYLTSRDGMKTMSSQLTYDKQRRTARFQMIDPMNTITVTGTKIIHDSYNGVHRFEVEAERNDDTVRTEFGLDMSGRKIDAKFFSPKDEMLHIYARYMRPAVEFNVEHQLPSQEAVGDILLKLNLDSDKLVTGNAYVRPNIWSDAKALAANTQFQAKFNREFEPVKRFLKQEWQAKQAAWERVSEGPQAAFNAVYDDLSSVATRVNRAVYRAYRANEFHLKDIYDATSKACAMASNKVQRVWRTCKSSLKPIFFRLSKATSQAMNDLKDCIQQRSAEMSQMFEMMKQEASALYSAYRPHVDLAIQKVRQTYKQAKDSLIGAYSQVRNHPRVVAMIEVVQDVQPSDVFAPLRKLKFRLSTAVGKFREEHSEVFQALDELWTNIAQRQEIRDLALFLEAAVQKIQRFWEKYDVQKMTRMWLKNLSKANWKNLQKQAMDALNEYLKLDRTRWTNYDPKNGRYTFELYVPFDLKELNKLPKFDMAYYIRQAQRIMDDLSFDEEWCVWDTIYKYMPASLDVRDWIPPFKSHATIGGNQHFMTFDKRFYEFSGECSYLLARDFIDGYFSVVVNYKSESGEVSKKSITVFSNDKQVELYSDGHIELDGRLAEMPLEVEGTIFKRVASMIYIQNPHGVNIDCDLVHDRCTVSVSGWYFGKTAGLMGTYDNEPVTDLVRSDNSLASNIEEMAESWIVGSRCRATNYANTVRADPYSREYQVCAKYFVDSNSPFRPCFKQVSPEPYMTQCLNSMEMNSNRLVTDEDTCNVASYYVHECKMNSANIRLPRLCVTCQLPDGNGKIIEGENMTLTEVPDSADVVFVIQHGDCNREVMNKMNDIIQYFERTFQAERMTNIRYGIVGFGGNGAHSEPSERTINGQVMSDSTRDVLRALNSITFDGPSPGDADVMSAVRFAAMYPFRMGVSKSVIVLPCADCREGATRYTELQRILIERDVRLHMLMDHTFTLKGTKSVSPKSGLMFGMDKDGLFIDKHVSDDELLGDAALRKQVTRPKDLCAALSDVTDGSVFARDMLAAQRTSVQKSFVDVFVRLVVKKAEPSQCQNCECTADNAMAGQAVCHHCEMNPIYNMMPDFEDEYEYEDMSSEESEESEEQDEEERSSQLQVEEPNRPKKFGRRSRDKVVRRTRKGERE